MFIGSHVSMSAPNFVLGSVEEALSYGSSAFMLYSGAPQNTRRRNVEELKIEEAHALMAQHNIDKSKMIVHAPYIINLANTVKESTFELAVSFLAQEIERVKKLGATYIVLHPGSHVNAGEEVGIKQIIKGLDEAMENIGDIQIALETMAGKGSEIGYCFEQLTYIIEHAKYGDHIKVCMDTCHMHDAGYDISNVDALLEQFDEIIGLDKLVCIHINDSKNINGAKKDRHANIGEGEIGFDTIYRFVHHPKLTHVVKILETPYIDGNPPYKQEIEALLK